jgi:lysophospholipase
MNSFRHKLPRIFSAGFFLFLVGLFLFTAAFGQGKGEIHYMETGDGAKIRYSYYSAPGTPHQTVLILQGRSSFIEKHQEVIEDFLKRGCDVWVFDWRGQGGSTRVVNHPQKNHIDSYDTYLKDMDQLVRDHVKPRQKGPLILFGSSMGGHLAMRYMEEYPGKVGGAILESPMFHVPTSPFPLFIARPLVRLICALGFDQAYVFGWGDFNPHKEKFENNKMTHDEYRFERQRQICIRYCDLVAAGPTFGWVKATFDSIDELMNPKKLQAIKEPILIINSGLDSVVNTEFDKEISTLLPNAHFKTYQDARHHIVMESDGVRARFWMDVTHFMEKYFKSEKTH